MQLFGILLALTVLIVLSLKGIDLITITFIASIIVFVTSGIEWREALFTGYMESFGGYVTTWMFVMVLGALFGRIMSESKSAHTIATWMTARLGDKYCILAIGLVSCLLTWVGVSGFVIMFVIAPLAQVMMREKGIPRFLLPAIIMFGNVPACGTLPYSIDVTNMIPTEYLGTHLGVAPGLGIIGGVIIFVGGYTYVMRVIRKHQANMSVAEISQTYANIEVEDFDKNKWPPLWKAALPVISVTVVIIVAQQYMKSVPAVVLALTTGCLLGLALNWNSLTNRSELIKGGVDNGLNSLCTAAAVMGFAGVVQMSAAFPAVIEAIMNLDIHPYITEFIGINVLSGIVGSSTSGVTIFMQNLGQRFIDMGMDPAAIHRIAPVAGAGLNSLPNGISTSLTMAYTKVSYRQGYFPVFIVSVVCPVVAGIIITTLCVMGIIF